MRANAALIAALLCAPLAARAQSGTTQSRDGFGTGAHPTEPTNSLPAGTENAASGPQGRPAYPSGSDTANPGAAFVRNKPTPATGTAASPPGVLSTTTLQDALANTRAQGGQAASRPGGSSATTEGAAPLPTPKP